MVGVAVGEEVGIIVGYTRVGVAVAVGRGDGVAGTGEAVGVTVGAAVWVEQEESRRLNSRIKATNG